MWDEDMVYEIAEGLMDWYFDDISTQKIFFNRNFIFAGDRLVDTF